jgi:dephospho-CoA kinase
MNAAFIHIRPWQGGGVLRVGLTGGIGSGKSEVARLLARRGAFVVDADLVARQVVEPGTPGFARVVDSFGPKVVTPDGALDRAALASVVFADPQQLGVLNGIVHPLVAARTADLIAEAGDDTVVVHDVPLLVENGLQGAYDVVVVVDAPDDVRVQRLVARGLVLADVRARMAAQTSREERLASADHVIHNDGNLDELAAQVDRLWAELQAVGP